MSGSSTADAPASEPRVQLDVNVASWLDEAAARAPEQDAVVVARGRGRFERTSFAELAEQAAFIARGLTARGVEPGTRACVFVRPGPELVAITFALLRVGAVPVIADPGMGRERLLACLERMRPEVFFGVPRAHLARRLFPRAFRSVRLAVAVGPRVLGGLALARLARAAGSPAAAPAATRASDPAAILFTSGSTGPPKGVLYTHGMFAAQRRALLELYGFRPGEVDLACFPLFALFDAGLGMTSVFPELDPSRPATCDPERIVAAIEATGATTSFGSPAIWRRVVPWCVERGKKLETLERVLVAGAPVPHELIREFHKVLRLESDVHTPYGATEALPVSSVAGRDVVPELVDGILGGAGTCVGKPAPGIELRLVRVTDEELGAWSDELEVRRGEPGEVCVRGAVVTHEYADEPGATRLAKIRSPAGLWHRMGDVGRLDAEGRLWLLGRKSHRIETADGTLYPVPAENVFNTHPRVHRTALVGVGERGRQEPVLVVEPVPGELPKGEVMTDGFVMQLEVIGARTDVTRGIETFLFHPAFPVDVRHNAKIHREELAAWASEQLA